MPPKNPLAEYRSRAIVGCVGIALTLGLASASAHALDEGPSKTATLPSVSKPTRAVPRTVLPPSARRFYENTWGVEILGVKSAESGSMLRFSYRVLDADKAQALNDKRSTPYLYDITSHVRLEVPSMEKVGLLRQSSPVEEGKVYWMVFSNHQRLVKPGTRVDIKIGQFLAQGILVE